MKLHLICTLFLVMHMYSGTEALNAEFLGAIGNIFAFHGLIAGSPTTTTTTTTTTAATTTTTARSSAQLNEICMSFCLRSTNGDFTMSSGCGDFIDKSLQRICRTCRIERKCRIHIPRPILRLNFD